MKGDDVADLVDTTRQEITERLEELRPSVEEYKQLEAAAVALEEAAGSTSIPSTPQASRPARAKTAARKARKRRGGRSRGSKGRAKAASLSANQRAIVAALEHGAHTVRELVTVTGMSDQTVRNNVKGLLGLERVGKVERGGKAAYGLPGGVGELAAAA